MRQPEAEEHGNMARVDKSDEKLFCIPPNGASSGMDITGIFRLPTTAGARAGAAPRGSVPSAGCGAPAQILTVWGLRRLAIGPFLTAQYDCLCRGGEDSKGIGRKYAASLTAGQPSTNSPPGLTP